MWATYSFFQLTILCDSWLERFHGSDEHEFLLVELSIQKINNGIRKYPVLSKKLGCYDSLGEIHILSCQTGDQNKPKRSLCYQRLYVKCPVCKIWFKLERVYIYRGHGLPHFYEQTNYSLALDRAFCVFCVFQGPPYFILDTRVMQGSCNQQQYWMPQNPTHGSVKERRIISRNVWNRITKWGKTLSRTSSFLQLFNLVLKCSTCKAPISAEQCRRYHNACYALRVGHQVMEGAPNGLIIIML